MKKSQGISLISLVITIVIIIILAGISIYLGVRKNVNETINTMHYTEIFELSEAVAQRALFNRLNASDYTLIGISGDFELIKRDDNNNIEARENYKTLDGWYKITSENADSLNLDKIKGEYLVNYGTNEIISLSPIYYEGTKYYALSELKNALGSEAATISSNRYDDKKGVNKPYVVNGMVPVKYNGSSWVVTNVEDDEWYDYASSSNDESGTKGNLWANVMLLDELEVAGMNNSEVRQASLSDLDGRIVTKEGSMFVWIPRYSRGRIEGEIKIVYSKLTEDYFTDRNSSENVIKSFESNGIQLTGIWVGKYDTSYIDD